MSKSVKLAKSTKPADDNVPDRLTELLNDIGIDISIDRYNNAKFIMVNDELKDHIPFDILSDDFRTSSMKKNTETDKIYVAEMINTIMKKKKISSTIKANTYAIVPFFEALGRLKLKDNHEVYNDRGLLRPEDKFTFRLVQNLKKIFPGIENKIRTQYPICTVRRTFIMDICIELSDISRIGIEFDEQHHFSRDKSISDITKRNLISRLIELRIFRVGDDFEHFLIALCYDIIKYYDTSNTQDMKLECVCSFIAYNIQTKDGMKVTACEIREYVSVIMGDTHVDIDLLSRLLKSNKDKVITAMKKYIKLEFIRKNGLIFNKKSGDIKKIHTTELLKFLMLYDDPASNKPKIFFARVIQEYLLILTGNYDTYTYRCPSEQFVTDMKDEILAYRMEPYKAPSSKRKKSIRVKTPSASSIDVDTEGDVTESHADSETETDTKSNTNISNNTDDNNSCEEIYEV